MIPKILSENTSALGISLSNEQVSQFVSYASLLTEWNQKMNLTAITEPFEIATKHFLDSLYGLKFIKEGARVIDVGTGAGFPGIPLKIACPSLSLTLLDSLNKRLTFLDAVITGVGMENVQTVHARAEEGSTTKSSLREQFDVSVSRAVSQLNVLSEYCLPYVKVGGVFLAYKGGDVTEELDRAKQAISLLGGDVSEVFRYTIPETDITHSIVVIKKIKPTPEKYPRQQGKISKQPL